MCSNVYFRTKYLKSADGLYGHVTQDGSLHGLLRMVNQSEADVAIDVFDLNRDLQDFIEFLPTVWKYK
jgi:hypothetical protein